MRTLQITATVTQNRIYMVTLGDRAIDTPLGRLDSSHRRNLIDQYFPHASHQMILLSTDTEIRREEVKELRRKGVIARKYLLQHDPATQQTTIESNYFW